MKRILILLFIHLIFVSCDNDPQPRVKRLLSRLSAALTEKSAEKVAGLFHSDAIILAEGSTAVRGNKEIINHFKWLESIEFEEQFEIEEVIKAGEFLIVQTDNIWKWSNSNENKSIEFVLKGQLLLKEDENDELKIYRYAYSGNDPVGGKVAQPIKGKFAHIVLMWLKDPNNQDVVNEFEKSLDTFINNVQNVTSYHLGTPADTYRPIIDTTYTYCLVVTFDTKADHDLYQAESAHQNFLKESSGYWEKILIYDSVME